MSKFALTPFHVVLAFSFFALPAAAATDARVSETYGKLPLQFEANRGQTDKQVRFLSRGAGYSLYLTSSEAVLVLSQPRADAKRDAQTPAKSVALRMSLVGATRKPEVSGLDELPGKANYFIGKDRSKWRTNVPTYAKVHYQNVYPGIDLVYYGNQRQLEYDFVVAPGADPKKIVLGFKGADKLEIDAQGDLVLHAAGGDIRQHKPVIYQEIDGVRQEIAGGYVIKSGKRAGFQLAAYDSTRPLIIDPVVLSYSTYLGGNSSDEALGVAVDTAGNAYVTGSTSSIDFPTTAGAFDTTYHGPGSGSFPDVFVTKLNPSGSALVYSTYIGSSGDDIGHGIAVDAAGNAYVTGYTCCATGFPTTPGAFQTASGGASDIFVTKLDPAGSGLVYSTYLGGSSYEVGVGIAVDSSGNAYVTGTTSSPNFPTTPGAFQAAFAGGRSNQEGQNPSDAYVTKLNATGSALVYSTYLGGEGNDRSQAIALDATGSVFVTGFTDSLLFPTTPGAFRPASDGLSAYVTKVNPAGSGLAYSTYLGGNSQGMGIAVDTQGNAYVTGDAGAGFPTTVGAYQPVSASGIFVAKMNSAGSALVYSTYLADSESHSTGIAVDMLANAYVAGWTTSTSFPTTAGALQPTFGGGSSSDGFVTKLNPGGSALVYSTYLGGSADDSINGIAVAANGDTYVTGSTYAGGATSNDFPTTAGAFQPIFVGGQFTSDAFVAKIADANQTPPSTPFYGTPFAIPGTFEAEDFDRGGEGVAYHDNVPGNAGGQYRPGEDVDIIASSDSAGGAYVVNNFETGEWLNYTINVQSASNYDIELRVTSMFADSAFHVEVDGVDVTGRISVPNTGSWSSFQWVGKKGIALRGGQHVLKIVSDQQYFDLNSVRVLQSTTRFEENAATYTRAWNTYGPETGTFSGGTILASNQIAATATFAFSGAAVNWIGVKCNVCGIAAVSVDGGLPTIVNTSGPGAPGSLASEVVFSASGLAPDVTHTLAITATGLGTGLPGLLTGGTYVAIDSFDVTR